MYETDNIAFECFVTGKCTTVLRGDIVWSIIKLSKKLETHSRHKKLETHSRHKKLETHSRHKKLETHSRHKEQETHSRHKELETHSRHKELETHSRQIQFSAFTCYHICWKIYWEILVPVYDNQDKVNEMYFYKVYLQHKVEA